MPSPLPLSTFHDFFEVKGAGSPITDKVSTSTRTLVLQGSGIAPRPASNNRRRGAEFRSSGFTATPPRVFATSATTSGFHTALYVSSKIQSFTLFGWVRPSRTGVTSIDLTPIGGLYSATNAGATPWVFDQPCLLFTPVTSGDGHLIVSIFGSILDTRTATQATGSVTTTPIEDNDYTFVAVRVTGSSTTNNQVDAVSVITISRLGVRRTYTLGEHKAAALLAFTANPTDGQTVTIDGRAYTFRSALAGTPAQGKLVYSAGNFADGDTVVIGQDSSGNPITYTARTYVGAAQAATQVLEFNTGAVTYSTSNLATRMRIGGWEITCLWGTKYPSASYSGGLGFGTATADVGAGANQKVFDAWYGAYDNLSDFKIPASPGSGTFDVGRSWANRRVVPGSATTVMSSVTEAAVARTIPLRAFDAGTAGNAIAVSVLEPTAATGVFDLVCSPCRVGRNATFIYRLRAPSTATVSCAQGAAGNLAAATYKYTVTFVHASGESVEHNPTTFVLGAGSKKIDVSSIPLGPTGTTARKVYRTKGGGTTYYLAGTISDNTTTTFTDNTADASLPTTTLPTTMYMIGGLDAAGTKSFLIGATYADSQGNLIKAVNATGIAGTDYSSDITSANPSCSAAGSGNDIVLTSKYAGSAGNGKPLSETSTPFGSVEAFGVTVLGVDGATTDEILIGSTKEDSWQNLEDALNLTGSAGIQYGDPTTISARVTAELGTGTLMVRSKESGTTGNTRTVATTTTAVIRDEFNDKVVTTLVGGQAAPAFTVPSGARPDQSDLRLTWGGWVGTAPLSTKGLFYGTVSDMGLANRVLTDEECALLAFTPPPTTRRATGWYKAAHKARAAWKTERQSSFPTLRQLATGQASQHFDLSSLQGSSLQVRVVGVEAGRPWAIDDIEFEMDGVTGTKSLLASREPVGGLSTSAPPTQIGPRQSPRLVNCSYEGRRIRRRRGYEVVNNASTSTTAAKAAIFDATNAAGDSYLLALIDGTLYQIDGDTLLSLDTGWDQNDIPTVATVGLKTFILSEGRQRIFQQGSILTIGVTAPTNAPLYRYATANVTGGVIALTPGYEYIYTFYDGTKATESGPSPITKVVLPTGSSSSSITLALAVSASSSVTERRVYRRKVGTQTWFSVGAIEDNTTIDFTDLRELPGGDTLESPLGIFVTAEFPPITACTVHEDRLVGYRDTEDGRQVWISETGDGERWHVLNVFAATSKMESAISVEGRLVLLSDCTVEVIEGDWVRGSSGLLGVARRVLTTSRGCSGPHAACEADGRFFWHDVAGIHTMGRGWDAKDLTTSVSEDILPTMQAVVDTANGGVVLRYNHTTGELWCLLTRAVPTPQTGDGPKERIVAVMHLASGRWSEFALPLSYVERVKDGDIGFRFMGADAYGNILDLNVFDGDGCQGNESWFPASTVISGVSSTAKTVTVTGASFPTTMRGVSVVLVDVSASLYYRRTVLSASGSVLTLDDVPSALAANDECHVGGMVQLMDTRAEDGGRPGIKTFKMVQFSFADATVGSL